jgi:hypothetical protein
MSDGPTTPMPVGGFRWGGLVAGLVAACVIAARATSNAGTSVEAAHALGLALGACAGVTFAWQRSTAAGVFVAFASAAVLGGPGATEEHPVVAPVFALASSEQHAPPVVRTENGDTWLVHPMGVAVRVGPRTTLDENEEALRATRYSTLLPDMTATSWIDPDTALRIDLIVFRVNALAGAERDAFCQGVTGSAVSSLEQAGATSVVSTARASCDVEIAAVRPDGVAARTRLLMLAGEPAPFAMVSVIGDTTAAEPVLASVRRE